MLLVVIAQTGIKDQGVPTVFQLDKGIGAVFVSLAYFLYSRILRIHLVEVVADHVVVIVKIEV